MGENVLYGLLGGSITALLGRLCVGSSRWLGPVAGMTGLGFALAWPGNFSARLLAWWVVFSGLGLAALDDLHSQTVSDWISVLMALAGLALRLAEGSLCRESFYGLALVLPFGLLAFWGLMGWGDSLLVAGLAFLLDFQNLLNLLCWAFGIGGTLAGLALILKKTDRKDRWPLVPFFLLGALASLWQG